MKRGESISGAGARARGRSRVPRTPAASAAVITLAALSALITVATLAAPATPFLPGVALAAQPVDPPPPMGERSIDFPPFEEFTLDNGLRVVVLTYGAQPVMSARLYTRGGAAAEPAELAGVSGLAATVLTRGTETRTADEISETIEGVGGSLGASSGSDFLSVSATVLTDQMDTAFELLADVVRHARFPEDEVELARRQTLSALQAQLGQPQAIAQRRFGAVVYGEEHPYGISPTPETVRSIDRGDIVAYRDRVLQPDGALLLVAGSVERDRIEALARRHLGEWEGGRASAVEMPALPEPMEAGIHLVHRPGSVQSVVAVGHPALEPGHPDHFPLLVMNRVLGGGADARLFRILREEKGWTYGAFSQVTRPAGPGVFQATAEVRTEVTDSTLVELLHQMERMREEPVPPEELDAARNFLAGSFPLRLETAGQVAGQLATTLLLDLPLEEMTRYPDRIRQVTDEEVRRAAREHLHPDRAAIIIVGDAGLLLESLERIAPVELYDVEGRPLDRDSVVGTAPDAAPPEVRDGSRLEPMLRRYDVHVQGTQMGAAEYRLERDGAAWVSTSTISAATVQESTLRFSADDLTPLSVEMEGGQGPMRLAADIIVEDGRITGRVELPEQLGGDRSYDGDALRPGTLLAGMEEYALAVADLEEGAHLTIRYLDLTRGDVVTLEAEVTGREEVRVPAGTFDTWRVELTGGRDAMILYLRADAPHILVRQEYANQPVRLDLTMVSPL